MQSEALQKFDSGVLLILKHSFLRALRAFVVKKAVGERRFFWFIRFKRTSRLSRCVCKLWGPSVVVSIPGNSGGLDLLLDYHNYLLLNGTSRDVPPQLPRRVKCVGPAAIQSA